MPGKRLLRFRGVRGTRFTSLLIGVGMSVVMIAIWMAAPSLILRAEFALYDQHFHVRGPRAPHGHVAVVAIDQKSLGEVGRWPWSRSTMADLTRRLDAAGVAAIAFDIIYAEPEQSGEARAAQALRQSLAGHVDALREIDRIVKAADHDGKFAESIRASERTVLGVAFQLSPVPPVDAPPREGQPLKSAMTAFANLDLRGLLPPVNAVNVAGPIAPLRDAAQGLGHVNMVPELDGVSRYEALVVEYRGYYYPSLALEGVRVAAGVQPFGMKLDFGNALYLGELAIPVDPRARVLIDYVGPNHTIPHVSAADVLAGRVPAGQLKDKLVFVGATAEGLYDLRSTPFSPVLPGVEKHANMAANLLEGRFIVRPEWVELFELVTIIVAPILLGLVLPRLRPLTSLAATAVLAAALVVAAHIAFRQGLWLPVVYPSIALALTFTGITVYRFLTEERQRLFTKKAFQQYVSPEVVERIVANPEALAFGGEVRNLSILFCDIREFTTFAERHDPPEVVARLREHLTRLTQCVFDERGTLDKYIGDAVMAIFGAPIAQPDHAVRACRAALNMIDAAEQLNAKNVAEGKEPLRIGIGINSGDMVVGNLGSEQVFSYTVTGDAVNLGSRVESLNKDYATSRSVIITEFTYEQARDAIDARPLGEVKVKGKARPVQIFELVGMKSATASSGTGAAGGAG